MNTNEADGQQQLRQRRARINRIKTGIITTIAVWMIGSLLAIIILSAQVIGLNHRLQNLENDSKRPNVEDDQTNSGDGAGASSGDHTQSETEPLTEATESQEESASEEPWLEHVVTGIDTPENMASEGDVHKVYLTFNSIPGDNTEDILDVLSMYDVKATFFVVGSENEADHPIYQRIVNEGHTIGMHSYSNQYSSIYASTEDFKNDYLKISDFLYTLTGIRSQYYRFPGGSGNQISNVNMVDFARCLNEEKIVYFDWNVSAGDTVSGYTKEDVINNVLSGIEQYKTSVVLLHDGENKSQTVEALGTLIETLQQQGAVLLPIDENTDVIQYIHADSIEQ